jgi:hypothetical protein
MYLGLVRTQLFLTGSLSKSEIEMHHGKGTEAIRRAERSEAVEPNGSRTRDAWVAVLGHPAMALR